MMKKIVNILLLFVLLIACNDSESENLQEKNNCGVDNVLEDLDWLKSKVNNLKDSAFQHTISQAVYKGETVFILSTCCISCGVITPVYNCSGKELGILGNDISEEEIKNSIELWKSKESCSE